MTNKKELEYLVEELEELDRLNHKLQFQLRQSLESKSLEKDTQKFKRDLQEIHMISYDLLTEFYKLRIEHYES